MDRIKELVKQLDWDGCVEAYYRLPAGSPIIDAIFDRMDELDAEKFENWL